MSSPLPDSPQPKKPLVGAIVVSLLILAAALVWRFYGAQLTNLNPARETLKPVVFAPTSVTFSDRARLAVTSAAGADAVSTTQPVKVTAQQIDFGQGVMPLPPPPPTNLPNFDDSPNGSDADVLPPATVSVTSAWLVRFENSQLCNAYGACPLALLTRSGDDRLVQNVIFSTTAKNLWVSSHRTNGNPDLLVDYGVPNQSPVRLGWNTEGEFPAYTTLGTSETLPVEAHHGR